MVHRKNQQKNHQNAIKVYTFTHLGIKMKGCIGFTSVLFTLFGVALILSWQIIHDAILNQSMILKPNSSTFDMWKTNSIPLKQNFFLFNWTNSEDAYNSTVKPRFKQIGPYSFTQTKEKVNITWNVNNTVTFKHLKRWYFDPSRSNGTLNDTVVSINPLLVSVASRARTWNYFLKKGLNFILGTTVEGIVTNHSVGEVLFNGYEDDVITMANKVSFLSGGLGFDKFGWFYNRNGSVDYEGSFNMDTGETGKIGALYQWNGASQTSLYSGHCNRVSGYSGEFFPRNLSKTSIIKLFSPDLCRYSELEYEKEEVVKGIVGYKFVASDRLLDNGTKIPENRCFCDGNCMPSGALNVSACRSGSPIFLSLPHFFNADKYYNELIEGLCPKKDSHEFFMVLEPHTGFLLSAALRLQVNLLVQPIKDIRFFNEAPMAYFPILWFEQSVTVSDHIVFILNILLNFQTICTLIGVFFISTGLLIMAWLVYKIYTVRIPSLLKPKKIRREEMPLKS